MTTPLLLTVAGLGIVAAGLVAWRWPRIAIVGVALAPVVDRYLISLALPTEQRASVPYLSEALLAVVAVVVLFQATRRGTLRRGFTHPTLWLLAAFTLVAALSAVVNAVPPVVAIAGIVFTVEAAALFVLARVVPFDIHQARLAVAAFCGLVAIAATLAMGQVLIHPDFLGLESFAGRFGEGARVTSFLVNPNMLGAMLAMALPFTVLVASQREGAYRTAAWAVSLLLALALLYTFSRGAWFALAMATLLVGLVVERRLIIGMVLLAVVTFSIAMVLPRHLAYPERDREQFDLIAATLGRLEALGEGDLRVQFVENALPIAADHPLIGAGPGRYGGAVARNFGSPLYETYTAGTVPRDRTVDNFWLHLLVETGVIGLSLLVAAIGIVVAGVLRAARAANGDRRILLIGSTAVAVVIGVASLTEMLLEGNTTTFPMWLMLGIAALSAEGQ
ncbi:MAG TPA: O-antigen ligase family protein [Candidatus Limnocylindria bacterium]|nr:O-antigen ligase family protein [Candidatus Limnocylindria bacterium]